MSDVPIPKYSHAEFKAWGFPKSEPPVRSSEIVSLCGRIASKNAKRKLVKIWNRTDCNESLKIMEAFALGFKEGQSVQANEKLSD